MAFPPHLRLIRLHDYKTYVLNLDLSSSLTESVNVSLMQADLTVKGNEEFKECCLLNERG